MTHKHIIPTTEPFFFPGGPTGCLLVHGFTGTPKEMRLLGEHLHQQGHTVLGIRLTGHATQIEDMMRMRKQDWLTDLEDGWHFLQGCTERVVPIGLSMGSVLSLIFSSRFPVAGVVALSTPYQMPDKLARRLGRLIVPFSKVVPKMGKEDVDWFNPEAQAEQISYAHHPTRQAWELVQLFRKMQAALPAVKVPALVIQSRQDIYFQDSPDAERLLNQLGSQDKNLIWVENADHVITRDGDTSKVFNPVAEFVQRLSKE